MSRMPPEKLQHIKNRLKSSCCALCQSDKLNIELPEDRMRSIVPSYGGPVFDGLIIVCGNCKNSSYYNLERDCFDEAIIPSS